MVMFNPTSLERGLRAVFLAQLAMNEANWVDLLATVVPSNKNNEKYAWLGESPQMSQFIDEFKATPVSDTGYTLTNLKYGAMMEVLRDDISDDLTGGIIMRTRQLAVVASRHPNKLLAAALTTNGNSYDGVTFFNAAHPARGQQTATQSNQFANTGQTTALVSADLNTAVATMLGLLAENTEPFHDSVDAWKVVAPIALRKPIREALNATIIAQTSNVQFLGDEITPLFTARLTGNTWYLLAVDGPVRPLIFQDREPLTFEALEAGNDGGSDSVFAREIYKYKTRYRCVVGYSFWQKAVKVI